MAKPKPKKNNAAGVYSTHGIQEKIVHEHHSIGRGERKLSALLEGRF